MVALGLGGLGPVIAILGINGVTETTDHLMLAGILRRADVAHVMTVATNPWSVVLYPALEVQPDAASPSVCLCLPAPTAASPRSRQASPSRAGRRACALGCIL